MEQKKQISIERVTSMRNWLMANDIQFMELPQNYGQFQIFSTKQKLIGIVYATTEHLMSVESDKPAEHWKGFDAIQKQILNWYTPVGQDKRSSLRTAFDSYASTINKARKIITVAELPSGALEVQINDSDLESKYQYIAGAYDERMILKSNPDIEIVDFIIV